MSIQLYKDIQHKHITYTPPTKQGQIYYSQIHYKEQPLIVRTPVFICKNNGEEILKKSTHAIDVEIVEDDYSFYDFLVKLDDINIKETFTHSKEWFQKQIPLELIDDMYKRTNKPLKQKQKPIFQFKFPYQSGEPQCKIFNQRKEDVNMKQLEAGMKIELILHMKGLKFMKQHYYCDCYISQLKVHVNETISNWIPDDCVFSEEELDEEDIIDGEIIETIQQKTQEIDKRDAEKRDLEKRDLEKKELVETQIKDLQLQLEKLQGEREKLN